MNLGFMILICNPRFNRRELLLIEEIKRNFSPYWRLMIIFTPHIELLKVSFLEFLSDLLAPYLFIWPFELSGHYCKVTYNFLHWTLSKQTFTNISSIFHFLIHSTYSTNKFKLVNLSWTSQYRNSTLWKKTIHFLQHFKKSQL